MTVRDYGILLGSYYIPIVPPLQGGGGSGSHLELRVDGLGFQFQGSGFRVEGGPYNSPSGPKEG